MPPVCPRAPPSPQDKCCYCGKLPLDKFSALCYNDRAGILQSMSRTPLGRGALLWIGVTCCVRYDQRGSRKGSPFRVPPAVQVPDGVLGLAPTRKPPSGGCCGTGGRLALLAPGAPSASQLRRALSYYLIYRTVCHQSYAKSNPIQERLRSPKQG